MPLPVVDEVLHAHLERLVSAAEHVVPHALARDHPGTERAVRALKEYAELILEHVGGR